MSTTVSRPSAAVARFVAYDRTIARVGNPEDGTAISVRAETFVEEYASIRISDFTEKSNGDGFDTVYVKFDAASTGSQGMQHNFGASAEPGGPLADRLRQAHQTNTPVYVAIETRRRKHVEKKRDEPIDVQTPIHVLRGATGESTKGDPQTTKANCVKVIVAAGAVDDPTDTAVASEKDLRSDVREWDQLRANKVGDLPPEGWRCLVRDGVRTGGITNAPATGGTDAAAIAAAVAEHLADRPGTSSGAAAVSRPSQVRGRPGTVAEAKPWEPLNTDGRPNMGSELAAKIRAVHESAVYMLVGALEAAETQPEISEEESLDHVWGLTETLLWMADKVQEQTVGRISRHDRSHKEAGMWISQVITTRFPYTVEYIDDAAARRAWAKTVMVAASTDFTRTQRMMSKYLGVDQGEPEQAAPQTAVESASQPALGSRPAAQNTPAPQPQPEPQALRASEDPAAVAAWKNLAAAVDMTEHIDQLRFVLKAAFAAPTGVLAEIDAAAFREKVAQWATNPPAFRELAAQAFNNDPENKMVS